MPPRAVPKAVTSRPDAAADRLLDWYDRHRRSLPWRALPGEAPDPYRVWLSEIMLQQTTVPVVGPYFQRFLDLWPDVHALAAAPREDVMREWAGLGYYARARNLHACAGAVVERHGGRFPETEEGLDELPGIGPYSAAAIAAIAFDRQATAVDGNIERVVARLFRIATPLPKAKVEIRRRAAELTPRQRCGDYTQAMMDLGATICTPRAPKCLVCPLASLCRARDAGDAETLPRRAPKMARPLRRGVAFWAVTRDGAVLLRRRPSRGLLGGMMEVPSTEWRATPWSEAEALAEAPAPGAWRALPGLVRHGFTHLELELVVYTARISRAALAGAEPEGVWCRVDRLGAAGLPSLMRKLVRHALAHA
ncbi:MAG: A/G-specific adenine glycosylase [Alphaproteobacteria bacterium]|nr:A/G-specific adenine glycosylase [Alphaproteobacteria bacterium]